jgi:hypothetical protein
MHVHFYFLKYYRNFIVQFKKKKKKKKQEAPTKIVFFLFLRLK